MTREIQTYSALSAYKHFKQGRAVFVAHPNDPDAPMLSASQINDAAGHLFIIKMETAQ